MTGEVLFFTFSFALAATGVFFYKKLNEGKGFCIGIDINKRGGKRVCEGTGVGLLPAIWVSAALMLVLYGFSWEIIAFASLVSFFCFVGFLDDVKLKFVSRTTRGWAARAAPLLMAAGIFSWFYAPSMLWVLPFAVFITGAAGLQNTFAGLNGWTGGSAFIVSLGVLFMLWGSGSALPAAITSGAILGFLIWNFYPARVLEGDAGTMLFGSAVASVLVLGGSLKIAAVGFLFFLPNLLDFFVLKLLTNPKDLSQAGERPYALLGDGMLGIPKSRGREKLDFAKLVVKIFGPLKEWQIVLIIWAAVALNMLFWVWLLL